MLFQNSTLETVKFTLGIGLIIGSTLAFYTAFSRQRRQVQFAYHELHALTMLVYGTYILFFSKTFENLIDVTAFLLIFYAFKEIIFCNWLFNLGQKVLFKILFIRLFLGVLIGVGTITCLYYQDINLEGTIRGYGLLFMIIGINVVLYVPLIQKD